MSTSPNTAPANTNECVGTDSPNVEVVAAGTTTDPVTEDGEVVENNDDNDNNNNQPAGMGIQSQRRKSHTKTNLSRRAYQLAVKISKELKGQRTVVGSSVFIPLRDCRICRAQSIGSTIKRAHHPRCFRNQKTTQTRNKIKKAEEDYNRMQRNVNKKFAGTKDAFASTNVSREAVTEFFARRIRPVVPVTPNIPATDATMTDTDTLETVPTNNTGEDVGNDIASARDEIIARQMEAHFEKMMLEEKVSFPTIRESIHQTMRDDAFKERMKTLSSNSNALVAPIPMQALAREVSNQIPRVVKSTGGPADTPIARKQMAWLKNFIPGNQMAITVPNCMEEETKPDPLYTSIEGQQLLVVEWKIFFNGIKLRCPHCPYGELGEGRNLLTKSNTLFPIFCVNGPPKWAIVFKYRCNCCEVYTDSNDGRLLKSLPPHVAQAYPVEPKFAQPLKWHIDHVASDLFEALMGGYGNGNMFSKNILYPSIVKEHSRRAEVYYSKCQQYNKKYGNRYSSSPPFVKLHGEYITCYPPDGSNLRKLHNLVLRTSLTKSGISDYDRATREIQSVTTSKTVIQDHTCEVTKNYVDRKKLGDLKYCWTCATETGEIASAVMVPTSSAFDFSHAAQSLTRRAGFNPKVLYSDTWPNGNDYWVCVFGENLQGRLGMFHFLQRIVRTLRQNHVDYIKAVADLCSCLYRWEKDSYNTLLKAFQEGVFPAGPKTCEEIHQMQFTKTFKRNYSKFLMKEMYPAETAQQNLKHWFARYKATATDETTDPAGGRLDPNNGKKLFTPDTRKVLEECLKKVEYITDPVPTAEMYWYKEPTTRQKHS